MGPKRNTVQKELVKRIVLESCDHPTAEEVYCRARQELASISLGTVYRILRDLVTAGEILEVHIPGKPLRFDRTTSSHAHFICSRCLRAYDVDVSIDSLVEEAEKDGFAPSGAQVTFFGVCDACK